MDTINLIATRKALGLTQEKMAKIIGVARSTYGNYEKNINTIPIEKLNIISNKYNLSLDYLTGYTMENDKNFNHLDIDKEKIRQRLKEVRHNLNMTQREFSEKTGMSKSSVNGYENGNIDITIPILINYAEVSHMTIDWLCCKK